MLGGNQKVSLKSAPAATGVPLIGVGVSYLNTFIKECGGRNKLHNLTTAQVCEQFVKPRTSLSKPLVHYLENRKQQGRAKWFISHTWQYKFLDLVDAITAFFKEKQNLTAIIWLDLFSLPQHQRRTIEAAWLKKVFTDAISAMGNVVMVFTHWNQPVTLTRAWCVFELYACSSTPSTFNIALPPRELEHFRNALKYDAGLFYQTVTSIRSENCEATKEEDLHAIQKAIRDSVGFEKLDRTVFAVLFNWMVRALRSHIKGAKGSKDRVGWMISLARLYIDRGSYEKAETLLVESRETLGDGIRISEDKTVLNVQGYLAFLHLLRGNYHEAETLYRDCLDKYNSVGRMEGDRDALACMAHLATALMHQQRYHEGETLLADCLERSKSTLGDDDSHTLKVAHHLGDLYHTQGCYEQAEPLYVDCMQQERRLLGDQHPRTLASMASLAGLYQSKGDYQKAEGLYLACFRGKGHVLGKNHPSTLATMANLACLHDTRGDYALAEQLYVECLDRSRRVLGDHHPNTFAVMGNLASLYDSRDQFDKAEALYVECLEGKRKALREDNLSTITSMYTLALMYRGQGQSDRAEQILTECVERARRAFGDNDERAQAFLEALSSPQEPPANDDVSKLIDVTIISDLASECDTLNT
ncbi:Kinesin light chain 3 [Rhizophlyctis rosea]|nr:Kinesin light chain 3 [Rhizophlyctis rosea]